LELNFGRHETPTTHYNSEGYVLLGKKTADVVEAFYKDNE